MQFCQYSMGDGECSAELSNEFSKTNQCSCVCSLLQQPGIVPIRWPALETAFAIFASFFAIIWGFFQVRLVLKKTSLVHPCKICTLAMNLQSFDVCVWLIIGTSTTINHGVLVPIIRHLVFMTPCNAAQITTSISWNGMVHDVLAS